MTDTTDDTPEALKNHSISTELHATDEESRHSLQKDEEIEHLRKQISHMSEAMRLLAAQIRNADLTAHPIHKLIPSDDQTVATDCDTVLSEEGTCSVVDQRSRTWSACIASVDHTDMRLCEITDELTRSQTADVLALQNAAAMLQEHVRLASQEAVLAVHDTVQAQSSSDEWKRRAIRAEDQCAALWDENAQLKMQNEKLGMERRVLVKEVRKLRKAESSKQDYWKHFESYLKGAMNLHEQRLKNTLNEANDDMVSTFSALSDEGATVTLKTDKPIHIESETSMTRTMAPSSKSNTPRASNSSAPTSPTADHRAMSPSSIGNARVEPQGAMLKVSNLRRQVQRRFGSERHRPQASPSSPPESIDFYAAECVSPVMSYDSNDGVWSVEDSNHSKRSVDGIEPDKECSGCVAIHGN